MTISEWRQQWARLAQFHVPVGGNRERVGAEWFAQLKRYHVEAVERGITELIGNAQDNFLPGLGVLRGLIQSRIDKYERVRVSCPTCHGSGWIEAWPVIFGEGLYESFTRCPDCGIPAPQIKKSHYGSRPATKLEYEEWKAGRYLRDTMPDWAKAKPWRPGAREAHIAEISMLSERLRQMTGFEV